MDELETVNYQKRISRSLSIWLETIKKQAKMAKEMYIVFDREIASEMT